MYDHYMCKLTWNVLKGCGEGLRGANPYAFCGRERDTLGHSKNYPASPHLDRVVSVKRPVLIFFEELNTTLAP